MLRLLSIFRNVSSGLKSIVLLFVSVIVFFVDHCHCHCLGHDHGHGHGHGHGQVSQRALK